MTIEASLVLVVQPSEASTMFRKYAQLQKIGVYLFAALCALMLARDAFAMTATLIDCTQSMSYSGLPVWVGTYSVPGYGTFERTFSSWCPATLQVR
jgi:hypothetical protein